MRAALVAIPLVGLATGAFAADLPRRVAPPLFSWTGFYSGLFAGYETLDSPATPLCLGPGGVANAAGCPLGAPLSPKADSFIAGSEIGYNYQVTAGSGLVIGAAADIQFNRLRTYGISEGIGFAGGGTNRAGVFHAGQRIDSLGTARGRIGYAFDHVLVYGTGGLAFANVRIDTNTIDQVFAAGNPVYLGAFDGRKGAWRTGYAVGGGVEYAFTDHLSVKGEALYFDLGSTNVLAADSAGLGLYPGYAAGARVATSGVLTRIGLNYRFGDDGGLPFLGIIDDLFNPSAVVATGPTIWDFETGERVFYSTGTHRYTLGDPFTPGQVNSRLTYRDFGAYSGETFARLDHNPTGLFLKGFFGSGFVSSGGRLNDEDFPPAAVPYSNTVSKIKHGDISYAAIDAGYNVFHDETYKLGIFVGYQYYQELADGFGCRQIATNPGICGGAGIPNSVKSLTENAVWDALRVGLAAEARFDRFKVAVEGAYLPVVEAYGYDRHWLRPDINPLPQRGRGDGYFAQGLVSYDLTANVAVGVGARYWRMETDRGTTKFPFAPVSPTKFETDRFGGFLQISHKMNDLGLGALFTK